MGSMYAMIHGKNPQSGILLYMLGIDQKGSPWRSGRFRDIYVNEDGTEIILYTRNGGGNRDHYYHEGGNSTPEPGKDCQCTGCTAEYHLPSHPNYLRDWDDDFDCTYAYFSFSIPEEFREAAGILATGEKPQTIHEKFQSALTEMQGMSLDQLKGDRRFAPLLGFVEKITSDLKR